MAINCVSSSTASSTIVGSTLAVALRRDPYRLWGLFEMIQRFSAADFSVYMLNLERATSFSQVVLERPPTGLTPQRILHDSGTLTQFSAALEGMSRTCDAVGLSWPVRQMLYRLYEETVAKASGQSARDVDFASLATRMTVLRQAIIDDLSQHVFLYIPAEKRKYLDPKQQLFGDDVHIKYPAARLDIAAAGRCFALDEWTACVFHLMRVLEIGLNRLAESLGLTLGPAENWKNILDQIEKEIRELEQLPRDADKMTRTANCAEAAVQFRYFKDAWRNHVSHARAHCDEREARQVYQHVDNFMRVVAAL
jgi:hypothetical protein